MPTLDSVEIPKPKNWQDFERLVESYARINWPGCMITLFGGVGQNQRGVDIYIKDKIAHYIGIQCKKVDRLTYQQIEKEIEKAKNFKPPLKHYFYCHLDQQKRDYDKDFKQEAIKLSYEIGPTAASEKLGVPVTTLYTWRNRTKQYGEIAFVGSGHKRVDPKTAEIKAMEKKIKELEAANDILKRALGFFAESQKK